MKSKFVVTVFCVFAAMFLMGFHGDSTENNEAVWAVELPPPPPGPELLPEGLPEELAGTMSAGSNRS